MKKIKQLHLLVLLALASFFYACNDNENPAPDPDPIISGAVIINEGNFGAGNGSISLYDETEKTVTNNVVKGANDGAEIAATIQSAIVHDNIGYIICNGPDKIEIISAIDGKYLSNPVTEDVSQPRYMTVAGGSGYITCWGPWAEDWTLQDSYVAVMDLSSRSIVETLECGSGPEGILAVGSKLFVANSFDTSITVIDVPAGTNQTIAVEASPKHFVFDGGSTVWVSMSTGLQSVEVTTLALSELYPATNVSGKLAADQSGKKIYLLTAEPWPGTGSEVMVFDMGNKSFSAAALVSGENFYGIGFNSNTQKLYVSDSKGFSGNGVVNVYDTNGNLQDEPVVGVGPNGFLFN